MYDDSWNVQYENECRGGPPITTIKHSYNPFICFLLLTIGILIWMTVATIQLLTPLSLSSLVHLNTFQSFNSWSLPPTPEDNDIDNDTLNQYKVRINFTLQRQHYNLLPMFNKTKCNDEHVVPNYVFLHDYNAIIEPYANMFLYIYNKNDASQNHHLPFSELNI